MRHPPRTTYRITSLSSSYLLSSFPLIDPLLRTTDLQAVASPIQEPKPFLANTAAPMLVQSGAKGVGLDYGGGGFPTRGALWRRGRRTCCGRRGPWGWHPDLKGRMVMWSETRGGRRGAGEGRGRGKDLRLVLHHCSQLQVVGIHVWCEVRRRQKRMMGLSSL